MVKNLNILDQLVKRYLCTSHTTKNLDMLIQFVKMISMFMNFFIPHILDYLVVDIYVKWIFTIPKQLIILWYSMLHIEVDLFNKSNSS